MGLSKKERRQLEKAKRLATVEDVMVFRTLYGAPFDCPHCGEQSCASSCPHCGHPNVEMLKGEAPEGEGDE